MEAIMDKDKTPIYEIYVMELPWQLDEKKFPTCGIIERVGFYYNKEDAIRAVEENWCDLQDHYAQAAEIRRYSLVFIHYLLVLNIGIICGIRRKNDLKQRKNLSLKDGIIKNGRNYLFRV